MDPHIDRLSFLYHHAVTELCVQTTMPTRMEIYKEVVPHLCYTLYIERHGLCIRHHWSIEEMVGMTDAALEGSVRYALERLLRVID